MKAEFGNPQSGRAPGRVQGSPDPVPADGGIHRPTLIPQSEDRLLLGDDEVQIASILAQKLSKEGYSCVTAHDGESALGYFLKGNFGLIISDIRMPGMSGIDLLKQVRAVSPKMTVIMMTAYPEIDMAVEAIRFGAYDFLMKPVDLDLVALSVKKALDKRRIEEEVENYRKNLERLVEERTDEVKRHHLRQRVSSRV